MICGALAWCYMEKGKGLVVLRPPRSPLAERMLNWTAQFDVPVWGIDKARGKRMYESLSSLLLEHCSPSRLQRGRECDFP